MCFRKQTSIGAITGPIAGFGSLAGVISLVLWLKRRRERIKQRRNPEQFIDAEGPRNNLIRPMQEKHENPAHAATLSNPFAAEPESNVAMEDGTAPDETLPQ